MNPAISKMLEESAGRYLTEAERRAILDYTDSLPKRMQVAAAIQQIEEPALRSALEQVRRKYPEFFQNRPDNGVHHTLRDFALVLRYSVLAMICDDRNLQADRILGWMASMLSGLNFTPQFNRDSYTYVRDAIKANLPPDQYALIEPFLAINIEILGGIPEPQPV
ncbi:globin family protein [Tuwongella immobilis]|uniref:Phycobilisome protein n=1 Tax=Tuwongella immobilis TaxID=692036 RepID=A0A6C2YRB1_9BACT|nr:hypothetical protein [Tuwongella immobilis]VIP03525.1 phycobilisome protein : Phycocyanin OS=Isosphaera pallida (strain ATCC 43644 / DSM 9630 / IS1B) GN=Isop_2219 PE=3 SV=1: Phycobilisome [Tuwongella immobilis]VTS04418.1 phycobilisome protein : Phycocyanin OS=Isosphaera pallida (strain ATCC 43644 / DSM 9630 / IS1B) GN=Isop_2219 PE=3 SV=1: Phycobilisome [Tuwongella immobilis]